MNDYVNIYSLLEDNESSDSDNEKKINYSKKKIKKEIKINNSKKNKLEDNLLNKNIENNSKKNKLEDNLLNENIENNYKLNKYKKKYIPINELNKIGIIDEYNNLPLSINEAIVNKKSLTLKQITSIMGFNGLFGEMFNIIHDNLQKTIYRHRIKIIHHDRIIHVSYYSWKNLLKIEHIILNMLESK